MESPARELETELVEKRVGHCGCVLGHDGEITSLLLGGAVPCVLAEILVLGVHLDAGDERRCHARSDKGRVVAAPVVIEPQRPEASAFASWVVSEKGDKSLEACWKQARCCASAAGGAVLRE